MRRISSQSSTLAATTRINCVIAEPGVIVQNTPFSKLEMGELAPEPDLPGLPASIDQAFDGAESANPTLLAAK